MAATVIVNEKNTAGETPTDKTGGNGPIRFKAADNATVDFNDPLVIPATGTDYSFEKIVRLNATGTFNEITNYEFYMDGANNLGTGVDIVYKKEVSYGTPIDITSTAGFSGSIFAATSGAPVALGTATVTATGDFGDYLTMVMSVASTASPGVTTSETLTFAWDEV